MRNYKHFVKNTNQLAYFETAYQDNSLDIPSMVEEMQLALEMPFPKATFVENKETLGQVFTLPSVAAFMVKLLDKEESKNISILDPCIGPNTFPKQIATLIPSATITSIEIDKSLLSYEISSFYQKNNRKLILENFFDFPITEKFDAIIQNPPYVRHELLTKGENNKEKILKSIAGLNVSIPQKSNLYIYFLLKSLLHLKEGGKLVAITYDSWLYSEFGAHLKRILLQFGQIEAVYHFKKNAFPNASVGATIIEFTKIKNFDYNKVKIDYFLYETPDCAAFLQNEKAPALRLKKNDFLTFKGNLQANIDFKNTLFTSLEKISSVKPFRGLGTIANQYFIFDKPMFDATLPLIKEISKIKSMSVKTATKYILCAEDKMNNIELQNYLLEVKEAVEKTPKLITLRNAIAKNNHWYKVEKKQTGNIVFNYFLRKNIDFILNINDLQVSDNFYILICKENIYAIYAILNSTFSKLAIFENSRNQGEGLRKIQLFEFNKVPIINPEKLGNTILFTLENLGKTLSGTNRFEVEKENIIDKIDLILLDIYNQHTYNNLTFSQLKNDYQKILNNN